MLALSDLRPGPVRTTPAPLRAGPSRARGPVGAGRDELVGSGDRATAGQEVPRWFHEGIAESFGNGVDLLRSQTLAGAIFGLVWALIGYAMTGGQRDFTSIQQVVATKYEVLVEHRHAARARELVAEMDPMRAAQEQARIAIEKARADEAARAQAQAPHAPGA